MKNLTIELAGLKKGYRTPATSVGLQRSSERRISDPGARRRKYSHTYNSHTYNSGNRLSTSNPRKPKRKLSLEQKPFRSRTPSPYGTRFDPTAYIEQKKRQQSQQSEFR